MAQVIKYQCNTARALELKMWFNGIQYIVYLGGLPLNIKTGYAAFGENNCEEEYITENNVAQTEYRKSYMDASKLFEEMRERWLE